MKVAAGYFFGHVGRSRPTTIEIKIFYCAAKIAAGCFLAIRPGCRVSGEGQGHRDEFFIAQQ